MMFELSDRETNELWVLQRDATVLLSVSATSMCLAFGMWLENAARVPSEETETAGEFLVEVGMPLFALVAVLFAVMAAFALKRRREAVARIEERRREAEADVTRLEDSPEPGIVAGAREPSRTLLRW